MNAINDQIKGVYATISNTAASVESLREMLDNVNNMVSEIK